MRNLRQCIFLSGALEPWRLSGKRFGSAAASHLIYLLPRQDSKATKKNVYDVLMKNQDHTSFLVREVLKQFIFFADSFVPLRLGGKKSGTVAVAHRIPPKND